VRRSQHDHARGLPVRASDAELPILAPIIERLLDELDPRTAREFRANAAAGGKCRMLVRTLIDVDVIALARIVRDFAPERASIEGGR
jgi:hypothetical protein